MIKKLFEKLLNSWPLCPMAFVAGCVALAVGTLTDSDLLQSVGFTLGAASLCLMLLLCVLFLLRRRFALAVTQIVSAVGCLVLAFLVFIMIGAGQHHPPRMEDDMEIAQLEWSYFAEENTPFCKTLGPDIPKGSWWTDGSMYYQVKRTGATIRMEGGTLHEGGGLCVLHVDGDTLLTIAGEKEGYTTFGEPGRRVTHHLLFDETGDSIEVLVAYDADGERPVAALQRFDGDELGFELNFLHQLLAATYQPAADSEERAQVYDFLQFFDDGTVATEAGGKPRPYGVELAWHMPSDVIRMPDNTRLAVALGHHLHLYKAYFDAAEEEWTADSTEVGVLVADDGLAVLNRRLFATCATTLLKNDVIQTYADNLAISGPDGVDMPIPCLNSHLMYRLLELRAADGVDDDVVDVIEE